MTRVYDFDMHLPGPGSTLSRRFGLITTTTSSNALRTSGENTNRHIANALGARIVGGLLAIETIPLRLTDTTPTIAAQTTDIS
jgi:hypothetical protein